LLSKSKIKLILSLRLKKFRKENGLFVIEGEKPVEEIYHSNYKIRELYFVEKPSWLLSKEIDITEISEAELKKVSSLSTPNNVLALVEIPELKFSDKIYSEELVLALEDIRDPGNLGTIIRTADWFGIKTIFCSKESVDCFNQKVVQSTMGSITRVSVHYVDLGIEVPKFENSYITVLDGENLKEVEKPTSGIIIFGNESNGVSKELIELSKHKLTINKIGGAESLNVATAAAIFMYEFSGK
jgi:TrmH family RNA methyltransferase